MTQIICFPNSKMEGMDLVLEPGLVFQCYPEFEFQDLDTLTRTHSTYQYGQNLETYPCDDYYVICKDGSVQSMDSPEKPIGWELISKNDEWYYRITQFGFEPKKLVIVDMNYTSYIPEGRGTIGTKVEVAYSRQAAIYEDEDSGEPEVTSKLV